MELWGEVNLVSSAFLKGYFSVIGKNRKEQHANEVAIMTTQVPGNGAQARVLMWRCKERWMVRMVRVS